MPNKEAQNPIHLDDLYRDLILDHYRNPRNKGALADATVVAEGWNPSCGDEIQVSLRLLNGTIAEIRFSGQGCSISQSSASMMTDETHGQPLERVRAVADDMQRMLTDEDFDLDSTDMGDLEALQGVARFPLRVKCALLAWKVLEQALAKATGQAAESDSDIQTRIASG